MTERIHLRMQKLPHILAELTHSNQFLKISAFFAYALCFLLTGIVYSLVTRAPEVLTLAPDSSQYERIAEPSRENAIRRMVHEYLNLRYGWEPNTVAERLDRAKAFILPTSHELFNSAIKPLLRFAKEKNITQRIYADDMTLDITKKTILIKGERITSIQGLKAVGDFRMELSLEFGERTKTNPWGIYVKKETER